MMKSISAVFVALIFSIVSVSAQNYDEYLQIAYQHLQQGNIEKAQNAYLIYCDLSELRDLSFEHKLDDVVKNDWKAKCYIIEYSDSTMLAVQRLPPLQEPVSWEAALNIAEGSRLGGFTDWRLPSFAEMNVISSNLQREDINFNSFWLIEYSCDITVTKYKDSYGRVVEESKNVTSIYPFYKDHTKKTERISVSSGYGYNSPKKTGNVNNRNYFIVRHYYKNDIKKTAMKYEITTEL